MTQLVLEKGLGIISLPDLKASVNEVSMGSKPLNGIRHAEVFEKVEELMNKHGLTYKIDPIYIRDGGPSALPGINKIPIFEQTYGKDAIEAHTLRRLIGKYQINEGEDKVSNTGIAINYHQSGIQIGYGPNVKICQNFSIFADHLISSTTVRNLEKMFEVLENFIQNHSHHRQIDQALLNRMMEIEMSFQDVEKMIGELEVAAVKRAYLKGDICPLNIGQVSEFTKNYVNMYESKPKEVKNLWGVYNVGTALYKPADVTDITTMLPMNQALGNFIMKKFDFKDIFEKYNLLIN